MIKVPCSYQSDTQWSKCYALIKVPLHSDQNLLSWNFLSHEAPLAGVYLYIPRVGQNHTYIRIYGVFMVFLAGKSLYIWPYTVHIYSYGQLYIPYACTYILSMHVLIYCTVCMHVLTCVLCKHVAEARTCSISPASWDTSASGIQGNTNAYPIGPCSWDKRGCFFGEAPVMGQSP